MSINEIICASCGGRVPAVSSVCPACGGASRVAERYLLLKELGRGGAGITWLSEDSEDGARYCLKALRWAEMSSLDEERLFEWEAAVLQGLAHPAIPRYIHAFSWGQGAHYAQYLVQEFVDGEDLSKESRHRSYTEAELVQMGAALAQILVYLHGLHPPMVHRDIKPSNIMRRHDGQLVLVDFGAARPAGLGGASRVTVAGTFGYMAPEQLRGESSAASDIYALAMSLGALASGRGPESLLDLNNRPRFDRLSALSPGLRGLLGAMTALDPADRPSALEVSDAFERLSRQESLPFPTAAVGSAAQSLAHVADDAFEPPARRRFGADYPWRLAIPVISVVMTLAYAAYMQAQTKQHVQELMREIPAIPGGTFSDFPGQLPAQTPGSGHAEVEAPLPPGLSEEQGVTYRQLLHDCNQGDVASCRGLFEFSMEHVLELGPSKP